MKNDLNDWIFLFKYVLKDKFQEYWLWQLIKEWITLIIMWWHELWIRKDEFHSSLDYKIKGLSNISAEKGEKYEKNLERRREFAHKRDILKTDKEHGMKFL